MKVRATRPGFYVYHRVEGDVFEIASPDEFSKVWMKALDEPKKPKPAEKPAK